MSTESQKKELLSLLYTDELTQIFNRRYLKEVIPGYLVQADEENFTVAFYMLDMDNFKAINDSYGHREGDRALKHLSKIIAEKIQDKGIAIRYAGDEFVLIVSKLTKKQARELGMDILQKIKESPFRVKDKILNIKYSAGVSLFPKDGKTLKTLFRKADEALYTAKDQGKGRVVVYPDTGKLLTPSKLDSILSYPHIVGRDDTIQFLDKHLSGEENPLVFPVLFGDDGTGKSRLMQHARETAQQNFAFTLFAKGYPFWESDMYSGVLSALGILFEQEPSISDEVFSKLEDRYKLILKPHISLWDTKEVEEKEEVVQSDRMTLFEALTQVFIILREMGNGAVLLDDADQIDQPSLQFFDSQFEQTEESKLFFVSSINSPDLVTGEDKLLFLLQSMPEVTTKSDIQKFQLEPLRLKHVHELVANQFDGKTLSAESEVALLHNSDGNPLFILEALSFLLIKGKIEVVGNEWDLSLVNPEDIPSSLSEMIKERLMRMSEEAINVLKMASLLGDKINAHQLAEISELKLQQVMDILHNAQRQLFIEETPNPEEFVFAHRMDRSIFYSLMTEDERRQLHARAAEIEQKFSAGSLERVVGKLAYHFQNTGRLDKAAKMISILKDKMDAVFISKGAQKILKKRMLTASLAKESPLEPEDLSKALEIGRALRTALNNLRLYPKEHENVKNSVERMLQLLEPFLAEKTEILSISVTPETVLFNGLAPPVKAVDPHLTEDLYEILNSYGLQGLLFVRGITQDELERFLDLLTKPLEEVAGQWDTLVEELELSHVLPDRKMFVAVGERKIELDKQDLLVQAAWQEGKDAPSPAPKGASPIPDEQLDQLKDMLDQFSKDKQELLSAVQSGSAGKQEFKHLINLLQQTDISEVTKRLLQSEGISPPSEGATPGEAPSEEAPGAEDPSRKYKYADVLPDVKFVEQIEKDLSLAFEDLSSEDTRKQGRAAAWLTQQEPERLASAALKRITSDVSLKAQRLAAGAIHKAGVNAVEAFLGEINPDMPAIKLLKLINVADMFINYTNVIPVMREIALSGPTEAVEPAIEVLEQIPGKEVDLTFLDLFELAAGKTKLHILYQFAKRKIIEAVPMLLDIIKPKWIWEKETRISFQAKACRALGLIGSPLTTEKLIAVATKPKLWAFQKTKPEPIRAAATWALRKLPSNERINTVLEALKKDKSLLVRKAARS
ncbi:MAG: diguanylate cyclase [Candidatus Aminicenantes bacterium]|nr:diguanylate cyclase [Candidatus Aminicenantes bacterium]